MVSKLRRLLGSLIGLALVASALAPLALAAPPERVEEEQHISNTFPAGTRCPFEVIRTIDGTLVTTTRTDADGLTTITRFYKGGKIRYLNPANGKTLTAVLAGPVVFEDNGDGTTTLTVRGNAQRYTAPGMGFIVGNTGLWIGILDNATGEILSVEHSSGHQDGTPFPALCVGLE